MAENGQPAVAGAAREAAEAAAAFHARDYARACAHLQALGSASSDLKLRHNLALAEYFASGARAPGKLLAALEGLKKGHGEGELVEDNSLATYNAAVLHFQQQRIGAARALLGGLFGNVEPLDEFLAFRVCLLLLEVTLLQRDVAFAAQVLAHLDRSYAALTRPDGAPKLAGGERNGAIDKRDSGGDGPGDGSDAGKAGSAGGGAGAPSDWPNKRSSRPSPVVVSPAEVRVGVHLGRARLHLLLRAPQPAKRELKLALGVSPSHPAALFLKVQLELLRGNGKQALKLLAAQPLPPSAQSHAPPHRQPPPLAPPNQRALHLNTLGCVHYGLGKYALATLYFARAAAENKAAVCAQAAAGAELSGVDAQYELSCNLGMGCLHAERPADAFALMRAALPKLWPWARLWLRMGECCIALNCEQRAAGERARAGIAAGSASLGGRRLRLPSLRGGGSGGGRAPAATTAVADGAGVGLPDDARGGVGDDAATGWDVGVPSPSLAFAAVCFRNALAAGARRAAAATCLAGGADSAAAAELAAGASPALGAAADSDSSPSLKATSSGGAHAGASGGPEAAPDSDEHAARLKLSWVCLELSDPLGALSALGDLQQLLHQPSGGGRGALPAQQRALALSYAAEGLCQLGRCAEAVALLSPAALAELHARAPLDDEVALSADGVAGGDAFASLSAPLPPSPPALLSGAMRCVLATNAAAAHIANDDLHSAELCCQQALALQPRALEPRLLLAHCQMRTGHAAAALALLRSGRAS